MSPTAPPLSETGRHSRHSSCLYPPARAPSTRMRPNQPACDRGAGATSAATLTRDCYPAVLKEHIAACRIPRQHAETGARHRRASLPEPEIALQVANEITSRRSRVYPRDRYLREEVAMCRGDRLVADFVAGTDARPGLPEELGEHLTTT